MGAGAGTAEVAAEVESGEAPGSAEGVEVDETARSVAGSAVVARASARATVLVTVEAVEAVGAVVPVPAHETASTQNVTAILTCIA